MAPPNCWNRSLLRDRIGASLEERRRERMTKHRVRKGRRMRARGYSPLNGLGTGGPKTRVPDARQHEQLGTNTHVVNTGG